MPAATLLLREDTPSSLAHLVEKSQQRTTPLPQYDLELTPSHLDLIQRTNPEPRTPPTDEGFESDIDTLSIVSSDGSFTKTNETDSANGSASSDSDTETNETIRSYTKESYSLVECVCYTDVKYPQVLVFVIKNEALVFKFDDLNVLRNFYLNFTALKAVTNQKAYAKNSGAKFNLLQRTDNNGVTHIEITRELDAAPFSNMDDGPSSIISINTPEISERSRRKDVTSRQRHPDGYKTLSHYRSNDNLLNAPLVTPQGEPPLRKVWNSAEDLLSIAPKRPERRKKAKGKAPPPPIPPKPPTTIDVLRGEYVRVNVSLENAKEQDFIAKGQLKERKHPRSNLVTLLTPARIDQSWTNSVPRLLRKPRSRSETRGFTPMAYRYIDTTPMYATPPPMGNRLFGLSPKLREFSGRDAKSGWGEGYKNEGLLKSVIKKDEKKKKNEKKVTFSAYTTVQVV